MSSLRKKEVPSFKTHQQELNYWKEMCYELEDKYNDLLSSHSCSVKDRLEHPAKRLKIGGVRVDPFDKLGDREILEIMKYLSGKELLQAMEVSKGWKTFIEGQELLINRALEEIVVKPNLSDFSLPLVNRLFSNRAENRPYKHMETPLELSTEVSAFERHASTLTSLTIKPRNFPKNNSRAISLPELKSLSIEDFKPENFKHFSFPVLEHLKCKEASSIYWHFHIVSLREFLHKCPKLKELEMECFRHDKEDPRKRYHAVPHLEQPKIEKITISGYFSLLMLDQRDSLQVLDISCINSCEMFWLLRDLVVLKSLTIGNIDYDSGEEIFPPNISIEYLEIRECEEGNPGGIPNSQQTIQKFIKAVPSLKELLLRTEIKAELIQFLASDMNSLEKFKCLGLYGPSSQAYQEIRDNPQKYANSSFEVIIVEKLERKRSYY